MSWLPPAVVLVAAALVGCASAPPAGRADEYFERGAYLQAAAAYEAELSGASTGGDRDRTLFRAALAHALAAPPFRDLEAARRLLQELMLRFPHSPYRPQALVILHLGEDVDRQRDLTAERGERVEHLSRDAFWLRLELEQLLDERQHRDAQVLELRSELADLRGQLSTLRAELAEGDEEIARLQSKLEELKRIDTQPPADR